MSFTWFQLLLYILPHVSKILNGIREIINRETPFKLYSTMYILTLFLLLILIFLLNSFQSHLIPTPHLRTISSKYFRAKGHCLALSRHLMNIRSVHDFRKRSYTLFKLYIPPKNFTKSLTKIIMKLWYYMIKKTKRIQSTLIPGFIDEEMETQRH